MEFDKNSCLVSDNNLKNKCSMCEADYKFLNGICVKECPSYT